MSPKVTQQKPFISKVEAARLLGVAYNTATKMTLDGTLRPVKIGGLYRIRRADVEALLKGDAA